MKVENPDNGCMSCKYARAYATPTWWCKNTEAIEWRGSNYANVCNCPFWELVEERKWWEKLLTLSHPSDGYRPSDFYSIRQLIRMQGGKKNEPNHRQ